MVALLSACTARDEALVFIARTAAGVASPFTDQCQSIKLEGVSSGGNASLIGVLSASRIDFTVLGARTVPLALKASCQSNTGQITGYTSVNVAPGKPVYVGSSEGSTLLDDYAKTHDTTGVFPVVMQ